MVVYLLRPARALCHRVHRSPRHRAAALAVAIVAIRRAGNPDLGDTLLDQPSGVPVTQTPGPVGRPDELQVRLRREARRDRLQGEWRRALPLSATTRRER